MIDPKIWRWTPGVILSALIFIADAHATPPASRRPDTTTTSPNRALAEMPLEDLKDLKTTALRPEATRFEFLEGLIVLSFPVEGQRMRFVVDTGATRSVITSAAATGLLDPHRHTATTIAGYGSESRKSSEWTRNLVLALPGASCKASLFVLPPDSHLPAGIRADGIIGLDILSQLRVRIDYPAQTIVFSGPNDGAMPAAAAIPVPRKRQIQIPVSLSVPTSDPLKGVMIIDTGDTGSLTLANSAALLPLQVLSVGSASGIGGEMETKTAKLTSALLGGIIIDAPEARILKPSPGSTYAIDPDILGAIGNQILRRFRVMLDLPHDRIFLEPNHAP